jgi:predicted oxidoreductase
MKPAEPCAAGPQLSPIDALREAGNALRLPWQRGDWTRIWQAATGHEVA